MSGPRHLLLDLVGDLRSNKAIKIESAVSCLCSETELFCYAHTVIPQRVTNESPNTNSATLTWKWTEDALEKKEIVF